MAKEPNIENGILSSLIPEILRRWGTGLALGILVGTGGMATMNKSWPDANTKVIESTMNAVMERIDKLELRDTGTDSLLAERGRIIDGNTVRILNLETHWAADVKDIKDGITRIDDKLVRHMEKP